MTPEENADLVHLRQARDLIDRNGRCSYCYRTADTVSPMFIPVHEPDAALGFYRDALPLLTQGSLQAANFVRIAQA